MELLTGNVGFEPAEAAQLLLSGRKSLSDPGGGSDKLDRIRWTDPDYGHEMRRRLDLVRNDGHVIGLANSSDYLDAITNWQEMLRSVQLLDSKGDRLSELILKKSSKSPAIVAADPPKTPSLHPAYKFLLSYFDLDPTSNPEECRNLLCETFVHREQMVVQLSTVIESMRLLERKGFSAAQLRQATPLLFYSHKIIELKLEQFRDQIDSNEENCLHVLLYHIDRQFQFSGNGFVDTVDSA